ncbi:unnamed protein product [Tuber melanosporum]|uniref:(Perigord truffle) hypothetical protein n=1 Tax=Tuber melanosporum (strain Mel28) TaxID=656061 RepID=D5GPL3_TUBMM|nr:uncharacterized protein GSTUM_00011902001 [Tuber melanosporum]CAZ86456.1 unnamed protein product [Tuber melanosporum]
MTSRVYRDRRALQYLTIIILLCCCFPYPHDKCKGRVQVSGELNSDRGV